MTVTEPNSAEKSTSSKTIFDEAKTNSQKGKNDGDKSLSKLKSTKVTMNEVRFIPKRLERFFMKFWKLFLFNNIYVL